MTQPPGPSAWAAPSSVPGSPFAPGHGSGAAPTGLPQRTGTAAWALGFLAYIPIPIVGQLVGVLTQAIVATRARHRAGLEGEQSRNAANWAWTYLAVSAALALVVIVGGMVANATGGGDSQATPVALTALGVWLFGLNLAHVVVTIIGTVKAVRGTLFRCPIAVRFLRG